MAFKMTNPFKQTKFPNSPGSIKRKFKKWIKGSESKQQSSKSSKISTQQTSELGKKLNE